MERCGGFTHGNCHMRAAHRPPASAESLRLLPLGASPPLPLRVVAAPARSDAVAPAWAYAEPAAGCRRWHADAAVASCPPQWARRDPCRSESSRSSASPAACSAETQCSWDSAWSVACPWVRKCSTRTFAWRAVECDPLWSPCKVSSYRNCVWRACARGTQSAALWTPLRQ